MLNGQCHCGNVSFTANGTPETLTECNCSICHRYGVRWAFFKVSDVTITIKNNPTQTYQWGDKMIDFHHCPDCGCVTHYTGTENPDDPEGRLAINSRMCPMVQTNGIRIRLFDGADTWKYLD